MVKKSAPDNRRIKMIGMLKDPIVIGVKIRSSHQIAMGIKASFILSSSERTVDEYSIIKSNFVSDC